MKFNELVKGEIYINTLDIHVPLMFTGKAFEQIGVDIMAAEFEVVRTPTNKNWFDWTKKNFQYKNFDYFNNYPNQTLTTSSNGN